MNDHFSSIGFNLATRLEICIQIGILSRKLVSSGKMNLFSIDKFRFQVSVDKDLHVEKTLNETRLDPSIPDGLVKIHGYDIVRNDRSRRGGGVCIYLRSTINYKIRSDLVPDGIEAICLEISKPNSRNFIVASVYRPPNSTSEFFLTFEKMIKIIDDENRELHILGDLNCDMLTNIPNPTKTLKGILETYQLSQLITEATRRTTSSCTLIDHYITSMPEKIVQSGVIPTGISDHSLIFGIRKINPVLSTRKRTKKVEVRNMKRFNEERFNEDLLSQPWEQIVLKSDTDFMWAVGLKINDSNITSTEEIANVFNKYFTNIDPNLANSIGDANSSFETFVKSAKSKMDRFKLVSVGKVVRLLNGLSNGKAAGLDKISGKILKAAASTIAPSLIHIFNNGLISNCFPYEWKMARLVPIHKKCLRNLTENYRPISILPAISKIMERIMYDQIYQYLTNNSLLSEHQFGFRKYHSTASALLDSTNSWYVNMDRKMFNLVVLLDLKKAFDTIDHGILLRKLELYGITGSALALIRSYFSDRNQNTIRKMLHMVFLKGLFLGLSFFLYT